MTENHKLKIRAAVAWEELTPRPDLTHIMKILGLELSFYKDKGSKQIVNDLTEHINNRIKTTVDRSSYFIRTSIPRTKTAKEKNEAHLELHKNRHCKIIVNTKSNSSNSRENSLDSIIENEENKNCNMFSNKNNTLNILSTVQELEMKASHREIYGGKRFSPSIVTVKRNFLKSLEKNDNFRKVRSVSPNEHMEK